MIEHRCYGCMQLHDGDFCPHCGWPVGKNNEVHQLPVGTLLHGQYEVGRVLGQGGFGITYLGWDRQLGAAVCIKEYFPSHAVSRDCSVSSQVRCHTESGAESFRLSKERFLREGRVLARFRDIPEIVSVYGSFEENDTVYIVMEYIKGMDLAHYVNHRGGRLSADETFKILKPVMEALAQVHRSELVHRDIAPDNIMLHPRGGAKLLDFGAARMVENADVEKGLDRSTEAIVKHGFAPMEQYQTRGNLGPWTDVYAMCASIYYCLTGQIPPEATTRLMGEADFSWATVPGLTDRQRQALEHGMAVLPKDRYRSMEELLDGLFGNAPMPMTYTEPVYAAPQAPAYAPQAPTYAPQAPVYTPQPSAYAPQAAAPKKRNKLVPILAGVLVGVVLLVVVALLVGGAFQAMWTGVDLDRTEASREEIPPAETETPAMPEPVETMVPATEAPATEPLDARPEGSVVGMIARGPGVIPIAEQLQPYLESMGAGFTLNTTFVSTDEHYLEYTEMYLASGCDAIVIEDLDPKGEYAQVIYELCDAMGVPVILVGEDPGDDVLAEHPHVCYAGADPRDLAYRLTMAMAGGKLENDTNGDGNIGYVLLTCEEMEWESTVLISRIPAELEERGYGAACLNDAYWKDPRAVLEKALLQYFDEMEVIFCVDAQTAEIAVQVCQEYGIDLWSDVAIIALAEKESVEEYYEAGYVRGYVEYSREMWYVSVAEAVWLAVMDEPLGVRYPLPCDVHFGAA